MSIAFDHEVCNSDVGGCQRCSLPTSRLCCNIHSPESFNIFTVPFKKPPRLPARSRLPKKPIMSTGALALRDALEDWRETTTEKTYGIAHLTDLGPTLVMPTEVLNRIVYCANVSKISTKDELIKETRWDEAETWASEVLQIIQRLCPPPPLPPLTTSTLFRPLVPDQQLSSRPSASVAPKERRCGACKNMGHNRKPPLLFCDICNPFISYRKQHNLSSPSFSPTSPIVFIIQRKYQSFAASGKFRLIQQGYLLPLSLPLRCPLHQFPPNGVIICSW